MIFYGHLSDITNFNLEIFVSLSLYIFNSSSDIFCRLLKSQQAQGLCPYRGTVASKAASPRPSGLGREVPELAGGSSPYHMSPQGLS